MLKKHFSIFILILALGMPFSVAAETAVVPTVIDSSLHFRPILHEHGVEFRWFRWSKPREFVSYDIRRADSKDDSKSVEDTHSVAETTNRYSTNFEERLDKGTYYYRLCIVTKTKRICSANQAVTIKAELPESEKKKLALAEEVAEEPQVTMHDAPAGELMLRADLDADGNAVLSWTPMDDSFEVKAYKPVRSQDNPNLYYPHDGYLAHILDASRTMLVDDRTPAGTVYYRVCAVTLQDELYCGNVAAINNAK